MMAPPPRVNTEIEIDFLESYIKLKILIGVSNSYQIFSRINKHIVCSSLMILQNMLDRNRMIRSRIGLIAANNSHNIQMYGLVHRITYMRLCTIEAQATHPIRSSSSDVLNDQSLNRVILCQKSSNPFFKSYIVYLTSVCLYMRLEINLCVCSFYITKSIYLKYSQIHLSPWHQIA